ncbi:MAG: hypothetical protein Q9190_006629 [Brigantiaea leucoxantha]
MLSTVIVSALFVLPLTFFLWSCLCLIRNVAAAKASGFPYVVTPWSSLNGPWLLVRPILGPVIAKLPFGDALWVQLLNVEWPWAHQYTTFERLGSDTIMVASPGKNFLSTADASAISQIVARKNDFPKPLALYGSLNIYGKNVVSTEGQAWRHHRKIVSPPFNEKNNRMVWLESLRQAQDMVSGWMGGMVESSATITTVSHDAMRFSLHVISCAGFGVNLRWPGCEDEDQPQLEKASKADTIVGKPAETQFREEHAMPYTTALASLLHNLIPILLLPRILLKHIPVEIVRSSYNAYIEWGKYMGELLRNKKADIAAQKDDSGMDLMGLLLKGAGITAESLNMPLSTDKGKENSPKQLLSDDEIMGNAFVFLLAGHETAANSIHFSIVYLAMHPQSQRRLQTDLARIFAGRPRSEWDYERDFPALFSGIAGAVLAEELRLVPPVPSIPKSVPEGSAPQSLVINGKMYMVPPGTQVNLNATCAHRNPNQWSSGPPSDPADPVHPTSNLANDLEEFKPERWLRDGDALKANSDSELAASAAHDGTGTSVSSAFVRPPRGAYIPFSEGHRACLGRRFAQVEVLVALAVIFSQYSVELAVDDWATDTEIERMDRTERKNIWQKARVQGRDLMREHMGMVFTMQMRKGLIPVRLVKRGSERFDF